MLLFKGNIVTLNHAAPNISFEALYCVKSEVSDLTLALQCVDAQYLFPPQVGVTVIVLILITACKGCWCSHPLPPPLSPTRVNPPPPTHTHTHTQTLATLYLCHCLDTRRRRPRSLKVERRLLMHYQVRVLRSSQFLCVHSKG